jgi:hypothetical protein
MFITVDHAYVETGLLRHICKLYPQTFVSLCYNSILSGYGAAGDQQANNDWPYQMKSFSQNIVAAELRV